MKNIVVILTAMALSHAVAFSQGCLPLGIAFTTQTEIDNFQVNYPGCSQIEGDVVIAGLDITNLNGLSVLTSFGGDLHIGANSHLTNLTGLNSVTYIGGKLMINDTPLSDLEGLNNLTTIGGDVLIIYMHGLHSLTGLDALVSVGGDLAIASSSYLTSIVALSSLTTIGGGLELEALFGLQTLSGLEALTSIGGDAYFTAVGVADLTGLNSLISIGGALVIRNSHGISSLYGLDQLEASSINSLVIIQNDTLSTCAIQPICEYLISPGGSVEIHDNATGCNSQEEVQTACDTLGVDEPDVQRSAFGVQCYPNPFRSVTFFEYELPESSDVTLSIFNSMGMKVAILVNERQTKGIQYVSWNAETVPAGIYFYRIQAGNEVESGRIIKW